MTNRRRSWRRTAWTVAEAPASVVEAMKKVGAQMADEWKATASPEAVAVLDGYHGGRQDQLTERGRAAWPPASNPGTETICGSFSTGSMPLAARSRLLAWC